MSPELAEMREELSRLRRELAVAMRGIKLIRPHLYPDESAVGVATNTVFCRLSAKVGAFGKYSGTAVDPSGTTFPVDIWNDPEIVLAPAAHLLKVSTAEAYIGWLDALNVAHISATLVGETASPKTVGDATEGSEAAESTPWTRVDDGKPCDLWVLSRVGYFEAGDKILYGYKRKVTIDANGSVIAVSGETRYTIDVPDASCS